MKGTTILGLLSIHMTIKLGVLGGIGPDATAEFYRKLIAKLTLEYRIRSNRDFPQIIINSIPAPELVNDEISEEEIIPYTNGLVELDRMGVDFMVMVCNTIHLYFDRLQKEVKAPILDMRKEVIKTIRSSGVKSVFIAGTPSTITNGLYRFKGIRCFEPTHEEMLGLGRCIFDFNRGFERENQINKLRRVCSKYLWIGS